MFRSARRLASRLQASALLAAVLAASSAGAVPLTVADFDAFADNTPLSTEIAGISLSGGTVLSAGIGLNEFDFPPHSGTNVLAVLDGSLTLGTTTPFDVLSAYFTSSESLTFTAFGSGGVLGSTTLAATGLGTSVPFSFVVGNAISYQITSASAFTLDDLRFGSTTPIPEPSTWLLSLGGLAALGWRCRRSRQASHRGASRCAA